MAAPPSYALTEDGFMLAPFACTAGLDGTLTWRHPKAGELHSGATVTRVPGWNAAGFRESHPSFMQWFVSKQQQVLAQGVGYLHGENDVHVIDYFCSSPFDTNLFFTFFGSERQRPTREAFEYARASRQVCRQRYRMECNVFILSMQRDGTIWCYRVKDADDAEAVTETL